ncbi:MAG: hypothetical protein CM15mP106_5260 [Candidatus Neomarinimicrobiota bacterium]|nr:MAG: hypothetical protein CM15mP106_5260 [Candidatus Neomarinimicrobiota bacterium]
MDGAFQFGDRIFGVGTPRAWNMNLSSAISYHVNIFLKTIKFYDFDKLSFL